MDDKVFVFAALLAIAVPVVAFRVGRYGKAGAPALGASALFLAASFLWLGAPLTSVASWVASAIAAPAYAVAIYGMSEVRRALGKAA